jgi:inhibitor of KinA
MKNYSIFCLGDQAVTISFGNKIDQLHHRKILAMKEWIFQNRFPGLKDVVIAYSSLTLLYDALAVTDSQKSKKAYEFVGDLLEDAFEKAEYVASASAIKKIPVCYEGEFAPDLQNVAALVNATVDQIIDLHTVPTYDVYMIGFLPGFPYMGPVTPELHLPRKDKPSEKIAAGSVGIAGFQTGIYPVVSPGGWHIIGRTPEVMFDRNSSTPCFLEPGDQVIFFPISISEFMELKSAKA